MLDTPADRGSAAEACVGDGRRLSNQNHLIPDWGQVSIFRAALANGKTKGGSYESVDGYHFARPAG